MKNNATKKALSLLMAALMVFSVLSPLPAGMGLSRAQAADPVPVASWADLKEAVKNGGAIEITENLVADSSITISKDVVITGAGKTIYRKDGNADFPMFSVTNGGKLSLGTGLTLSGQTGSCSGVELSACTVATFTSNQGNLVNSNMQVGLSNSNPALVFTIESNGKVTAVINGAKHWIKDGTFRNAMDMDGKDVEIHDLNGNKVSAVVDGENYVFYNPYWSQYYYWDGTQLNTKGGNKDNAFQFTAHTNGQGCDSNTSTPAGSFKVTWNDGVNDIETVTVSSGTLAHDEPANPPEEGYVFKGWKWETPDGQKGTSVGSANPNSTGFSVPSGKYGTMTIVAQWEKPAEKGQFNVFRSNGASSNEKTATHENVAVDVALKYTPPADWAPENGYVFKGWKWIDWNGNEGSSVGTSDPADTGLKVPSNVYGTLTLIAQWEKPAAPDVATASYDGGYNARIKLGNVTTDLVPVTISYNQGIQYNSPRKDDLNGTFYISTGRDRGLDSADFASANEWWQGFATNAEVATEAQNNGLTPKQGANGKLVYSPSGLETFPKYQWHIDGQGRLVNGLGWALSTNESGQVIFVNLNGSGGSGGSSGTPTPYTSKNPVAFAKETRGEGEQYESVDPTWSPDTTPAPTQTCEADGGCKIWKSNEYSSGSVEEPRGFFVKVNQGGTLNITGATLKDFITDASVQNVAPVAVKGGTFNMSGGSIEHNAVGYSANNDYIGRSVDQIEKQVKNVWTRTNTAGAIILTHGSQGNITGGTIQNNRADAGAIIVEGDGTAKKNTGTQTQLGLNGGTISNNFGVHYGGAIYIYNNGLVEMNSGAISNNFSWFKGGAVFASEEVFGSTQWGRPGTTQYVGDAAFIMKGGTLSGNMAVSRAGAIEVMSNHVILVDGDIINNSSRSLGGAIYVEGDGVDRMYTLVLQKGCISNNTAVNNVARPTDLSRVFKGKVATDCNFENILGVPGAGANIYDKGDYGGYYGHGGGIWLCSFGGNATFNINETFNVIVDGNHAVAGRGEDIQVHVAKGGSPNGVNIVGLGNNSFVNEATGNPLEEGTHYPGKLSIKNTDNRQSCDGCKGVNISGNVASNGGGIAANGTVVFGSDTNVYVPMTKIRLTKSWDEGVTKETITLKYYYKDENGNRVQLGDLDGYQVTFNGTADEKADAPGVDKYTENDPTWEQLNDSGDSFAEMAIPWVVTVNGERKATFILGLDNPVTINYKDARNNDKTFSGKEFDPSNDADLAALWTGLKNGTIGSNQLKIVKWNLDVVETNASGEEISYTLPDGEVTNLQVKAYDKQEKVFYDKSKQRLASVNTSVIEFGFNTNILNAKEEEPKVEKYVNDKVHADLEYFDQVFEYSVMAYVPRNATKVVLTDTLRKDLEFVNTTPETVLTSVVVYKDNDSDANTAVGTNQLRNAGAVAKNGRSGCPVTVSADKQTVSLTLDEAFLQTADNALFGPKGEAKDLDAVWVKMSFKARIKESSYAALAEKILSGDDSTKADISWEKVTTNASTIDSNGTAHTEVANGGEHAGMANKANYKVTIKNKGESSYDTNTVTVVPKTEDLTITKKWEGDTANNRPTEDEFKAALKVQSVKGQTVTDLDPQPAATITDNGNNTWTASWTGLPKLKDVTYQVAETKLAGYQNPSGSPAKNGETITNTKEKDTTTVKVTKVWENATEAEKTAIQVQLKKTVGNADPVNVGDPVTLNGRETTPWTYTWDGLEIEEEGVTIIYTVDEVDVPAGFTKIVAKDGTTGYKITNVKATTEKYVDKDVHSDIVNFDKEFIYDILVYVPKDATEFTITDTLVPGLEFADKDGNPSTEVSKVVKEVVWKTTNDHTAGGTVSAKAGGSFNLNTKPDNNGKTNPATIQDSTLTITIDRTAGLRGARGRWVQVTFYARIQDQYRTLDALKKLTGSWTEITNNTPVISQIGSHEGMRNKAEYTVKFGNNGEGTYETNTVTVKPEMVEYKAQKKWQDKDGADMTKWPAGASITFSLWKVPAVGEAECVETAAAITEDKVVTFTQQPKLKDVTYEVREEVSGVKSYQVGSPAEEPGNTFTFTNRLTDKDIIPAKLKLTASKTLEGATLKKGAFKFTIEAAKGNPANHKKQTKANDKNGVVAFDALEYTVAGTYTYTIKEVLPAGVTAENPVKDGITYDTTERTVVVEVAENDGVISISKVTVDGKEVTAEGKAGTAVTPGESVKPKKGAFTVAGYNYPGENFDSIYVGQQEAFCLDAGLDTPDGQTYVAFTATNADDIDEATIKKLLFFGMPLDSGTGEILAKITAETTYSGSAATDLLRMVTMLLMQDITNEKQNRNVSKHVLGKYINASTGAVIALPDDAMVKVASWIWTKVVTADDSVADRVELFVYKLEGNTDNRQEGSPQRIVVPVLKPLEYDVKVETPFTNSFEDQPEIAKYVNQNVHADLAAFDETFEYDILAYITKDADTATITDELDNALEFVTDAAEVKIYDLGMGAPDFAVEGTSVSGGEDLELQASIDGHELKVVIDDATALRGHWIRIHFEAKIADTVYEALAAALAKVKAGEELTDDEAKAIGWQKVENVADNSRTAPNMGNDPVTGGEAEHAGVANDAKYTIGVGGNTSKYEDTSNTVTVKPVLTEVKVSKAWYTNGEEDAAWPEGATVEVKLTKNGVPAKDAENKEITVTLSKDQTEYTFANLPVLEGVTYGVAEGAVNDAAKQYPLRKVEKVSDGVYKLVNEKVETEKYINNDVHVDLVEFDKVFKYDILVYVAEDTTQLTITDPLVKALEFAKASQDLNAKAVKATTAAETVGAVVVKNTNDHKVNGTVASANGTKVTPTSMSIANNTLTITFGSEENPVTDATGIRGKWLQVSFYAKYTDAVIKAAEMGDTKTITDNGLVLEGITPHEGTVNQASATMKVENGATAEPKTNEVTVKPETTKVEVSKTWMLDGKTAQWPEGATVEVKLTKNGVPAKDAENKDISVTLSKDRTSYTFENLPRLVGVTYGVAEGTVTNAGSYAIGAVEEDPENKGVFTITNKAFTPSIEKYVNKKDAEPAVKDNTVHTDLSFFDEVYTYDILAYVTEDAKYLVVTDELVKALQFAETEPSVTVVVKAAGENGAPLLSAGGEALAKAAYSVDRAAWSAGKLVLTMGSETSKTVLAQAGKWLQITFDAKIKDAYRSIEALKDAGLNAWETVEENKTDNGTRILDKADVTADFSGANAASHEGIINDASYTINKKAGAELDNQWQYECKSNTVTVQPKTTELKVEKLWVDADGNSIAWPEGVTITVQLQSKKGEEAPADVTGKTLTLNKDKTSDSFTGLPCLEGVIYLVKETPVDVKGQVYTPTVVYHEDKTIITNKPEKSEIQKFVNKVQPHSDLKGWDSVFRYDVVVYVPTDAVKIYMTDDLVSVLELVIDAEHPVTAAVADSNGIQNGEAVEITKLDKGVNKGGKLYATIEGISDSSEPALRGRYVTFTFYAQIKEGADLSAYKDNDYKVPNDARYIINDNPNYGDESNVVTVKPVFEDLTITKVWEGDKAEIRPAEEVFKANLKLTLGTQDVTGANADKLTITDNQDNTWTATWTGLKKYESKQYKVTEKEALAGYLAATYSEDGKTITNKATEPEIPEIEKYVNKKNATGTAKDGGVHTDLAAFDEVYTYDIQAYIAKDATVAEITDELVKVLEFVGDGPTAVVIKAGEAGGKAPKLSKAGAAPQDAWSIDKDAWKEGKLVLTLGKADSTEVLKAAGQWIQITFEAKIKDTFKSIDALKNAGADVWTTVVENDPIDDAKVDNDFSGAKVDSHEGIANDTSYRMKKAGVDVDNTWSYNDKSNTVTVQPKTTKLTVSKEWKTGTLVDQWPEGAEVEVKLTQTKDGVTTEVEGKTDKLTASKTTVIFADLPCLEGVTYGVAEGKVTNAGEYKIGEVKKVSEGVFQITNQREEEPEIEKYVNKKSASGTAKDGGVHTDLAAFYEVYTYDIQAYIAKDATVAEITDELKAVLEFVGNGPTAVVIKAGEAYGKAPKLSKAGTIPQDAWSIDKEAWKNGKLVLTLGKADSTEVLKAAGQWIQITFEAKIKDTFKSIDALKKAGADVWQTIVENDPIDDAKVDNAFSGAKVDKHEGIANDTSYRMKKAGVDVGNTWSYNDKSNTVTVQPKTVKVSVNKTWIGKPADALRLALRRDGVIIETVTISAGSKWSYEWKSLPTGYKYEVTESVPANFTQTGSDTQVDKDGNVTVSLENTRTTTVKINKTDLGGTELAGAVIEVKDANGEVIATWTSEEGKTMDLNLVPGEYTFREVNAPEGYECVTTEIGFTVNDDGTVTVTTTTVEPAGAVEVIDGVIVLLDKVKEFPVKINKTDLGGTELAGAVIEVKDANGEVIATWTSEEGKTMDLNLVPGEYTFREVNAPEGYECVTTEIGFTVDKINGNITVTTNVVEPAGAVEVIDGVIILKDELKKEEPTTETEEEETDETEPDDGGSLPPGDEDESTTVNAETESPSTEPETEPEGSLPPSDDEETTTVNAETTVPNTPPDTGDHSNLGLYIGLIAAAGVAGVGLLLATRKKKEEE